MPTLPRKWHSPNFDFSYFLPPLSQAEHQQTRSPVKPHSDVTKLQIPSAQYEDRRPQPEVADPTQPPAPAFHLCPQPTPAHSGSPDYTLLTL